MYYQTINYALQTFKVLQMTLYSRIFKILDSYMETLYRIPNFKCTYLKTCYLYCIYIKKTMKHIKHPMSKNIECHLNRQIENFECKY